jgi:uncharacterized protein YecE (DUF72 family)
MPLPSELSERFDPITADWTYIRWLGDRKGIERITTTWNKTVIDRTNEISGWVDVCYETVRRGVRVFGYANNHYAGHAPATIRQFRELWRGKGLPGLGKQIPERQGNGRFLTGSDLSSKVLHLSRYYYLSDYTSTTR